MTKTFASAGVSKLSGKYSLRCTNREAEVYADILHKEGHEGINIIKLKHEMSKDEARKYLSGLKAFSDKAVLECLKGDDAAPKKESKAPAKAKPAAAKKPPAPKAAKPKAAGKSKKKDTEEHGEPSPDVPTTEADHDSAVDAAAEMGMSGPAFAKHLSDEA
jgi:hypothetical protein